MKLLQKGMDLSSVMEFTGLSEEELKSYGGSY